MLGLLISLLFLQTPKVIASTNDWKITEDDYKAIINTFPHEQQLWYIDPENRREFVNELVRIWVLCEDARKHGAIIDFDYEAQKKYYQDFIQIIGSGISEEAVRKYYDDHADDFTMVGFSHILILNGDSPLTPYPGVERLHYKEAEAKAKEIKELLDKGADWMEMVEKYSQDYATKANGGVVGYMAFGVMERSLETKLRLMQPGEISDVVGSVFGFHILKLEGFMPKPFEEVHDSIRERLETEEVNRQIEEKVKAANVTIDESFFQ